MPRGRPTRTDLAGMVRTFILESGANPGWVSTRAVGDRFGLNGVDRRRLGFLLSRNLSGNRWFSRLLLEEVRPPHGDEKGKSYLIRTLHPSLHQQGQGADRC